MPWGPSSQYLCILGYWCKVYRFWRDRLFRFQSALPFQPFSRTILFPWTVPICGWGSEKWGNFSVNPKRNLWQRRRFARSFRGTLTISYELRWKAWLFFSISAKSPPALLRNPKCRVKVWTTPPVPSWTGAKCGDMPIFCSFPSCPPHRNSPQFIQANVRTKLPRICRYSQKFWVKYCQFFTKSAIFEWVRRSI